MLSLERQRRLLQHLHQHGSGNVVDLADTLGVSASTVRRDLHEMNQRGLLTRVYGGASLLNDDLEPVLSFRGSEHTEQKRRIGRAAAAMVAPGSTLLVTGGTTTEAMLPYLATVEGLTVLTNGLNIGYQLSRYPEVTVVMLGGLLRHEEMSLLGPIAEHVLADFHVDVALTSAFGIDVRTGMSGANVIEAGTDRRILQVADTLVVLADSSKFGRRGPVRLASIEQINRLVTDDQAPSDAVEALRRSGVDVTIC